MLKMARKPKREPSWLEVVGMGMMCFSVFGTMLLLWALLVG